MSCGPMDQASAYTAAACRFESCHGHVRDNALTSEHNMITVDGSHTHAIICVSGCVVMVLEGGCIVVWLACDVVVWCAAVR